MTAEASFTLTGTGFRLWPSLTGRREERSYLPSRSKPDRGYGVTLSGQVIHGYVLARPLSVWVEQDEEGMFLASDSVTTVYGYGDTGQDAVADYVVSLVEYYELLEESESLTTVSALDSLRRYLAKSTI